MVSGNRFRYREFSIAIVIALLSVFIHVPQTAEAYYQDPTKLDATYDVPLAVGVTTTYTIRAYCPGVSDANKAATRVQWAFYYNSTGNFYQSLTASSSISGDVLEWSTTFTPTTTTGVNFQVFGTNGNPVGCADSGYLFRSVYMTPLPGPVAALTVTSLDPQSINFTLTCGGSCAGSSNYSYLVTATAPDGTRLSISGNATSTSTALVFTPLEPNVSHTIEASVTFNGQSSATLSSTVTTPKPVATISALSVADTSATLTVGCTNCGALPSSFTVSAIPVSGGPAITSTTNLITGLQSETTYSFSVVVAFAGTTSDAVLWQGNPVMTLPFLPVISAVSPAALPLTGGTVTVTGENFTTSSELTLGGATLSFTIISGTQITFTAPPKTAGAFDLSIANQVGPSALSNAITYVPGPSLSTNSPILATNNGGTIVTLTGAGLATTTQVNIGSTTVSFSVVSDAKVRFVTAATSAGIVDIGILTVGGSATISNGLEFTTSALVPVVRSITPSTGPIAGGTIVTLTGQFFSSGSIDSVSAAINGVSGSSLVLVDDSTLTFVTPENPAGTFDVSVAVGGGRGTLVGAFIYTAPSRGQTQEASAPVLSATTPEITSFSTRWISAAGGEIKAEGRRLSGISEVTLGGNAVKIVSTTDKMLVFVVGTVPEGTWDLRLIGTNGTLTFQQAITVAGAHFASEENSGTLLGFASTLRFFGNSRTLNSVQEGHLLSRIKDFEDADTVICWGYTTAANPNAWAIAHATARAKAACDIALTNSYKLKTLVRLRYGAEKDSAMRSSLQFWQQGRAQ